MKTITIGYQKLRDNFGVLFEESNQMGTEVYYQELQDGWNIMFYKNHFYIKCIISHADLMVEAQQQVYKPDIITELEDSITGRNPNEVPYTLTDKDKEELLKAKINSFEMTFLKKAIKVDKL